MHQYLDTPPPPASSMADSFHTVSADEVASVPPTLTTPGWVPGSSADTFALSAPDRQSVEPSSPAAANMVWPCVLACSNMACSAEAVDFDRSSSHSPHEVEMTWSVSAVTIAL